MERSADLDPGVEVSLEAVTKRFGEVTALDGLSLGIRRGEFFGLLGPNGAGKTTLMSLVAGLAAPDAGTVRTQGDRGYVPQGLALYPDLTAAENLHIFGGLSGLRGAALRERCRELLAVVQLEARRDSLVKTFSGGMMRRLNLAASILHRPRLLLCDEPTVGVDPQSRLVVFELLLDLNRQGTTIIYSTHYMEEASRLCSRIGIIDQGRILALGAVEELVEAHPLAEPAKPTLEGVFIQITGRSLRE